MLTAEIVNYVPLTNIVSYATIGYECWKQGCSWLSLQMFVFSWLCLHWHQICAAFVPFHVLRDLSAFSIVQTALFFVQMLTPASGKATVPTAFTVCLFTFQTCILIFLTCAATPFWE